MVGLALCLPRVGQPQGLPVPQEILKTPHFIEVLQDKRVKPLSHPKSGSN